MLRYRNVTFMFAEKPQLTNKLLIISYNHHFFCVKQNANLVLS